MSENHERRAMLFNEANPGAKQNGIFAVSAIFLSTVWVTLSLRLWVRLIVIKNPGWDDALLVLAAVIFTAFCGMVLAVETIGGATRVNELDFPQLAHLIGMVIACLDLYIATMIVFKISLAIFYLRIMLHAWQRYVVVAAVVLNSVYGNFLFFAALFSCGDPSRHLENQLKGVCLPLHTIYVIQLAGCIINAMTDWIFAGLPIFVLAKTTMPLQTKASAGFIILLACCGSIISIVRIRYIKGLQPGPDFFNTVVDLCIWTIVECGLGIAAASAASLRPLFRSLRDPTRVIVSRSSIGVECKTSPLYSTDTGNTSMFSPVPDLENQGYNSRFSRWSLAPALQISRIRGKLRLTGIEAHERTKHVNRGPASKEATPTNRPSPLSARYTPMPPGPTMQVQMARQLSQWLKTKIRRSAPRQNHREISSPIPHIASCQVPRIGMASATSPLASTALLGRQGVTGVDYMRAGSPDWIRNGVQLASTLDIHDPTRQTVWRQDL